MGLFAGVLLAGPMVPAFADDFVVSAGTTETDPFDLDDDDTLTVEEGGAVDVSGDDAVTLDDDNEVTNSGTIRSDERAIDKDEDGDDAVITNMETGVIESTGDDAIRVDDDGTITNYGRISAGGDGNEGIQGDNDLTVNNMEGGIIEGSVDGHAIQADGDDLEVLNRGTITGGDGGDGIKIDEEGGDAEITNYGRIVGGDDGIDHDPTDPDETLNVTNHEDGVIIGMEDSGVSSDSGGELTNYGTIEGRGEDGVDYDLEATIENHGSITAINDSGNAEGISMGGGALTNHEGADIVATDNGVYFAEHADTGEQTSAGTVNNAGTIEGTEGYGIRFFGEGANAQNDTVTNSGTITGGNGTAIYFNDGDDSLTLDTGSTLNGDVEGGDGTDDVTFKGTGSEDSDFNDFESASVEGDWELDGTLDADETSVEDGGTLAGSGMADGNVDVLDGGTIAPGNSVGTFTVDGDYTHASDATYEAEVTPDGSSDTLAVTGEADIQGGTVAVNPDGGPAGPGTYEIVTADEGVAGDFDQVDEAFAFMSGSTTNTGSTIELTLMAESDALSGTASTSNQQGAAQALANMTPEEQRRFASIYSIQDGANAGAEARMLLDLVTGEAHTAFAALGIEVQSSVIQTTGQRMGGGMAGGMGGGGQTAGLARQTAARGIADTTLAQAGGAGPSGAGGQAWVSGIGRFGDVDGDGNAAGVDYTTLGGAAGFDYRFDPSLLAGLAVAVTRTDVDVDARASQADVTGFHGALYGAYAPGALYGALTLTFAYNQVDSERATPAGQAFGDTDGYDLGADLEAGYRLDVGATTLTPLAGLRFAHVQRDGFTETGPGGGLVVGEAQTDSLRTRLGARVEHSLDLGGGETATGYLGAVWEHEMLDDSVATTNTLAGTSFTVTGIERERDAAVLTAGFDVELGDDVGLFVGYSATLSADQTDHGLAGGITFKW